MYYSLNYLIYLGTCLWMTLTLMGCATNPMEQKREDVMDCTKELITYDAGAYESFEVCRQVYRLRTISEHYGK